MVAYENVVEGKSGTERRVDLFHYRARLDPPGDIGLIGGHNQRKPRAAKGTQRFRNVRRDHHLIQTRRRVRLPVSHHRLVEDAVSVKKDGTARPAHLSDSHLVCVCLSFG